MAQTEQVEVTWSWHTDAACRGVDAELFFPGNDEESGPAKAVCAVCPVRENCLAFALRRGERYGVWGGLTEKERTRLSAEAREAILRREHAA